MLWLPRFPRPLLTQWPNLQKLPQKKKWALTLRAFGGQAGKVERDTDEPKKSVLAEQAQRIQDLLFTTRLEATHKLYATRLKNHALLVNRTPGGHALKYKPTTSVRLTKLTPGGRKARADLAAHFEGMPPEQHANLKHAAKALKIELVYLRVNIALAILSAAALPVSYLLFGHAPAAPACWCATCGIMNQLAHIGEKCKKEQLAENDSLHALGGYDPTWHPDA